MNENIRTKQNMNKDRNNIRRDDMKKEKVKMKINMTLLKINKINDR